MSIAEIIYKTNARFIEVFFYDSQSFLALKTENAFVTSEKNYVRLGLLYRIPNMNIRLCIPYSDQHNVC
jgi:hypothetical protein